MDKEALVYVDLDGVPNFVFPGRLWARVRKNKESATFEYDRTWLDILRGSRRNPRSNLGPGPFHTPARICLCSALSATRRRTGGGAH